MIKEFYEMNEKFYKKIEQEFEVFQFGKYAWISLHLRYLIYYMFLHDGDLCWHHGMT